MSEEENQLKSLNPVAQKVVEKIISEVLEEVAEVKIFSADVLHYMRTKITNLIHERLGEDEIQNIDVMLDMRQFEDVKFAFRVNVPKEKAEEHILNS